MLGRLFEFLRRYEVIAVVVFFALLTIAITWRVLPNFGAISYNDAAFYWNHRTALDEVASTYSANYLGQNQASALFNYIPRALMIRFFDLLQLGDFAISYMVNFGVIFAAGLVYYFVFKKIALSRLFGLLAGAFVVFNNLTLEHFWVGGTQYLFLALIGFAFVFRECWVIYQSRQLNLKNALVFALASALLILPFYVSILLIFLFFFALFLGFILKDQRKQLVVCGLLTLIGIFAVHAYWVIPFLYNTFHISPDSIFGGNLEGLYQGFVDIAGYTNAINFFHYFNFFSRNLHQTPVHYLFYFTVIGGFAATLLFAKKRQSVSLLIFLLLIYVVFINLAVGPKSPIIGNSWELLWQKFTFLSFFRSFTRFLVVIIPLYVFYYAVFVREVKSDRKNIVMGLAIGLVLLLNTVLFTGDVKGNISAIKLPQEYREVASLVDANVQNNVLFLPNVEYEAYTWTAERSDTDPQSYLIKDFLYNKPALTNRASINLTNLRDPSIKDLFSFQNEPNFDNFESYLRQLNVGYVVIQKDLIDITTSKRVAVNQYVSYFSNSQLYEQLASNDHLDLYAVKNPSSVLDGLSMSFLRTSPTSYQIKVDNLSEGDLTFRRRLDNNWALKATGQIQACRPYREYQAGKIVECEKTATGTGEYMKLLGSGTVIAPTVDKQQSNAVNRWHLSAAEVKKSFPKDLYEENADGTVNVKFNLYYYPQAIYYWSATLSVVSILLALLYVVSHRRLAAHLEASRRQTADKVRLKR